MGFKLSLTCRTESALSMVSSSLSWMESAQNTKSLISLNEFCNVTVDFTPAATTNASRNNYSSLQHILHFHWPVGDAVSSSLQLSVHLRLLLIIILATMVPSLLSSRYGPHISRTIRFLHVGGYYILHVRKRLLIYTNKKYCVKGTEDGVNFKWLENCSIAVQLTIIFANFPFKCFTK